MANISNYKRTSRQMPQEVRDKISAALQGHRHSAETRQKISQGQIKAWAQIPQKPQEEKPIGFGDSTNELNDITNEEVQG